MDEGSVNYALGGGGSTPQDLNILNVTPMDFDAGGDERLGGRVRASQSKHLMARLNDLPDNRRTDEPRSTDN